MSRKKTTKPKNAPRPKREQDSIPWRYCFLTLICGLILVAGFFFAARLHFSSIDYGIKNSQLKKQKDELETAQRQLLLAKESALSPSEIKKAAKEYGFTDVVGAVEAIYTNKETTEKPKTTKVSTTVSEKKDEKKPEAKTEKKTVENADSKTKKGVQQAKLEK